MTKITLKPKQDARCLGCGLWTGTAFHMCPAWPVSIKPTREFMVQQAVLTAAGNRYPCAVREHRLAGALSFLTLGGRYPVHDQLLDDIRAEYAKIAARYA